MLVNVLSVSQRITGGAAIVPGPSAAAMPGGNKPFLWLISITGIARGVNIFAAVPAGRPVPAFLCYLLLKRGKCKFNIIPLRGRSMSNKPTKRVSADFLF
jgi:hypothetical protein